MLFDEEANLKLQVSNLPPSSELTVWGMQDGWGTAALCTTLQRLSSFYFLCLLGPGLLGICGKGWCSRGSGSAGLAGRTASSWMLLEQ